MNCQWPVSLSHHRHGWWGVVAVLLLCACTASARAEGAREAGHRLEGATPLGVASLDVVHRAGVEPDLQVSHSLVERHFWGHLEAGESPAHVVDLVVSHGTYYHSRQRGGELILELHAQTIGDAAELRLRATAREYRPLAMERDDDALRSLATIMLPRAMEALVAQIEIGAQVSAADHSTLGAWIAGDDRDFQLAAIREAVARGAPPLLEQHLDEAADHPDREVALRAARALYASESSRRAHVMMRLAQRLSRDGHIDDLLTLLPPLSRLDKPWVHLYLDTLERAHEHHRVRERVRQLRRHDPDTGS